MRLAGKKGLSIAIGDGDSVNKLKQYSNSLSNILSDLTDYAPSIYKNTKKQQAEVEKNIQSLVGEYEVLFKRFDSLSESREKNPSDFSSNM